MRYLLILLLCGWSVGSRRCRRSGTGPGGSAAGTPAPGTRYAAREGGGGERDCAVGEAGGGRGPGGEGLGVDEAEAEVRGYVRGAWGGLDGGRGREGGGTEGGGEEEAGGAAADDEDVIGFMEGGGGVGTGAGEEWGARAQEEVEWAGESHGGVEVRSGYAEKTRARATSWRVNMWGGGDFL